MHLTKKVDKFVFRGIMRIQNKFMRRKSYENTQIFIVSTMLLYEYTSSLGSIGNIFTTLMKNKSKNFASQYDSCIGAFEIGMKALIEQYKSGKI